MRMRRSDTCLMGEKGILMGIPFHPMTWRCGWMDGWWHVPEQLHDTWAVQILKVHAFAHLVLVKLGNILDKLFLTYQGLKWKRQFNINQKFWLPRMCWILVCTPQLSFGTMFSDIWLAVHMCLICIGYGVSEKEIPSTDPQINTYMQYNHCCLCFPDACAGTVGLMENGKGHGNITTE